MAGLRLESVLSSPGPASCQSIKHAGNGKTQLIQRDQTDVSSAWEAVSRLTVLSPLRRLCGPHSRSRDGSADPGLELRTLRPSEGSRLLEVTRGIGPGQGIVTSASSGPAERGRSLPVARHGGVDARLLGCVGVQRGPVCDASAPSGCPVSTHSLGECGQDSAPPQASVSLSVPRGMQWPGQELGLYDGPYRSPWHPRSGNLPRPHSPARELGGPGCSPRQTPGKGGRMTPWSHPAPVQRLRPAKGTVQLHTEAGEAAQAGKTQDAACTLSPWGRQGASWGASGYSGHCEQQSRKPGSAVEGKLVTSSPLHLLLCL